ncbi:hypothetical protein [Rhizohabitans arisaemae]|uniref:hypothetical protein n=1 Tax=Rhizohabitans arisaemae TaxID=2720610 RepID=UPI0024B13367|nr:hypothetical protein [Rhizohabitans arisaemae]
MAMPLGWRILAEHDAAGTPLTRDRLRDAVRETGQSISTDRAEHCSPSPGLRGSFESECDPDLRHPERYLDFLAARRELLAQASQSFLTELRDGVRAIGAAELRPLVVVTEKKDDVRAAQITFLVAELGRRGFAEPALDSEIADPANGAALAVAEAFWPDGLQTGQGQPVVLELDPSTANLPRLEELGYLVFTSVDALLGYAVRLNQAASGEEEAPPEEPSPDGGPVALEFEKAMRELYERARSEANYHTTYFLGMLAELGALVTARKLLYAPAVSDGFAILWERGRLDLTVEALVIQPRFADLFTTQEIEIARHRLDRFGY